jgi:hypothetical protein
VQLDPVELGREVAPGVGEAISAVRISSSTSHDSCTLGDDPLVRAVVDRPQLELLEVTPAPLDLEQGFVAAGDVGSVEVHLGRAEQGLAVQLASAVILALSMRNSPLLVTRR